MKYICASFFILEIITAFPAISRDKNDMDDKDTPLLQTITTTPQTNDEQEREGGSEEMEGGSKTMKDFADYMVADSWPNQTESAQKPTSSTSTSTSPVISAASTPAKK